MPARRNHDDPRRVALWEQRRHSIGDTIRRLRLERELTQEQLATLAGVDRTLLNAVERGRRSVLFERLFDIADALDVTPAELVHYL
jgi:transcriptional regulator with XRE-family HTH domain